MPNLHQAELQRSVSIRKEVEASARKRTNNARTLQNEISKLCEASRGLLSESRRRLDKTARTESGLYHALDQSLSRMAQNTAMERLRLLESVVVHANDAILITEALPIDAPGPRILYCNAAFSRMTGYEEDELRDKTPRLLQGPNTDRAVLDTIRDHLTCNKPVVVELLNYRKDGSAFWVELSIVPIWDPAGRQTHWISLQRDVSDRKAAAEAAISNRVEALERQALQTELEGRKQMEQRLFRAAFHDALTGLHNRAFFLDHLGAVLEHRAHEDELEWALLFLDLNRFKSVNDTLGHDVGNRLLIEVARRLEGCIGPSDILARMGGDEFALLADVSAGMAAAIDLADQIRRAFARPFSLGDHTIHSDCSIGIAALGANYRKPEDVLRDADVAMYRSKNAIGHRPALFTGEADADAILALRIKSDLFQAVEQDGFHLLYQPIFSAESGDLVSLETLIRWTDPVHGSVPPDVFIPLAEQCGLVRAIGRWVLVTALREMRVWTTRLPGTGVRLNVNVSPNELLDGRFAVEVVEALETAGFSPKCLELEITEAVFQDRSPYVLETLQQLRGAGIRLALDDFGTGYSSLGSIDSYPIDTIKVDKGFVIGMMERPRTQALVGTIITLAKALDLDVVAEGIETEGQHQALIAMGCHHFQGYHLARPMAFKDAMETSRCGG